MCKGTRFWKQFTTSQTGLSELPMLFQCAKVQDFESNSQLSLISWSEVPCCFNVQRYKILKAIHNTFVKYLTRQKLFQCAKVQDFESNSQLFVCPFYLILSCFNVQRYKILKAIHNTQRRWHRPPYVVSMCKGTRFWKQFTTISDLWRPYNRLFQCAKVQDFESNSQHVGDYVRISASCFNVQRYKILKAIHNSKLINLTFTLCCFNVQRYKILKAIHNLQREIAYIIAVVSMCKGTRFWKQFTTTVKSVESILSLFQCAKVQDFESNSQHLTAGNIRLCVVSMCKGTRFWKQFTTLAATDGAEAVLFQCAKVQDFESNSQQVLFDYSH